MIQFSTRDAVRVKVKKVEPDHDNEYRKFSVDPQITSYEILQSLLARAFDIRSEFTVSYVAIDGEGDETLISLLSDWDLEAAFLSASDPCLRLLVSLKYDKETAPKEWCPVPNLIPNKVVKETQPAKFSGFILSHVEKTFRGVQKALYFMDKNGGESITYPTARQPLGDKDFHKFLDPVGRISNSKDLRSAVYQGGLEPSLRKVVWKHILNVYPEGMTGRQRIQYIRQKSSEYEKLREVWLKPLSEDKSSGKIAEVAHMVRKDVIRTDRHHSFYGGSDDNENLVSLFNILTTYALNHPTTSYAQGMSDVASVILYVMKEEAQAYVCFCALMVRLKENFTNENSITTKFNHLARAIRFYDPSFYECLRQLGSDDLLFCYRWLVLELKREFSFEDSLPMLEVLWASLPPCSSTRKDLPLYDTIYCPSPVQPTPCPPPTIPQPIPKHKENVYTKVRAIRRQSSGASSSPHSRNGQFNSAKASPKELNDLSDNVFSPASTNPASPNIFRSSSESSVDSPVDDWKIRKRLVHKRISKSLSTASENSEKNAESAEESDSSGRLVKNLAEFKNFLGSPTKDSLEKPSGEILKKNKLQPRRKYGGSNPQLLYNERHVKSMCEEGESPRRRPRKTMSLDLQTQDAFYEAGDDPSQYIPLNIPAVEELNKELKKLEVQIKTAKVQNHKYDEEVETAPEETRTEDEKPKPNAFRCDPLDLSSCEEVSEETPLMFSNSSSVVEALPPPEEFGYGNPFLMFLCLTLLLQQRDYIMTRGLDYNEIAMHFDKLRRKHDLNRVLNQARAMFLEYLSQPWENRKKGNPSNV